MLNVRYLIKEVFAEKKRMWLTTFAIAWGTLSIVLMLSVGQGMLVTLMRYMNQLGSHLLVVSGGVTTDTTPGNPSGRNILLDQMDLKLIQHLPAVKRVLPEYTAEANMLNGEKISWSQPISGIGLGYRSLRHIHLMRGRWLNADDLKNSRPVIVLGNTVAKNLFGANEASVGNTVKIGSTLFTVIGVTANDTQIIQYETPDVLLAWMPSSTFQKTFVVTQISNLLVDLKPSANRALVKKQIQALLAIHHQANPDDKTFITIFDNQEILKNLQTFFGAVKFFLGLVGTVTLLVAGLGIANIMQVAVQRATAEIGIRMVCGARAIHIVLQYLLESIFVTLLGGVIGMAIAFCIILIGNYFLRHVTLFFIKGIQLDFSFPLFFVILLILGLIGLLSGIFPALRASRIQPVEALRHD